MFRKVISQSSILLKKSQPLIQITKNCGKAHQKSLNKNNINLFQKYTTSFCSSNSVDGQKEIQEILNSIKLDNGQNINESGNIVSYSVDKNANVEILLRLNHDYIKVKKILQDNLKSIPWISHLNIKLAPETPDQTENSAQLKKGTLKKVKKVIAVSSCKGGVGKSTVSVNLAFQLKKLGRKVGIFDADIYGPSLPTMLGLENENLKVLQEDQKTIIPIEYEGIKAVSYGFVSKNRAVLRGALVSSLISQLVYQSQWGELDYLIIDMPPGTGDIQITICQEIPLDAAVIVTTPQRLSFVDVVKGIEMFDVLKVPTVSIVENMTTFNCVKCDHEHHIFGQGYIDLIKKQFGIVNSFSLPLMTQLASYSDQGVPQILALPEEHSVSQTYKNIAVSLEKEVIALQDNLPPSISYQKGSFEVNIMNNSQDQLLKTVNSRDLRLNCQCAMCIDEFTGKNLIKEDKIPKDVEPIHIEPKGNYAVNIMWSDGHNSSIYPYSQLFKI